MPLYARLNLFLLLASFVFCFLPELLYGIYWVGRRIFCGNNPRPPRIPRYLYTNFPNGLDKAGCFLLLGLFMLGCASSCVQWNVQDTPPGATSRLLIQVMDILVYLPFILRLCFLPQMGFRYIRLSASHFLLAVGAVFSLFLLSGIYEATGLIPWIVQTTGSPEFQDIVVGVARGDLATKLYVAFAAIIVAPFGEECFFRGFLYNILKDRWGRIAAAIISSLMFASIHLALPQFIMLFIMALFQCVLYERARSIWIPIFSHTLFNSASVVATLLFFPDM